MRDTDLRIYQKITVEVTEEPYEGEYLSRVEEIGDGYLKVSAPINNGELVPLRVNMSVRVSFTGQMAAYYFETTVIGRENEPLPMLLINPPEEIKKIQRRQYFRLEANRDVRYRVLGTKEEYENWKENQDGDQAGETPLAQGTDLNQEKEYLHTTTIDISGGGIQMAVDEDLKSDTIVEIFLDIPRLESTPLIGEVVQHYSLPDGNAVGIFFPDIGVNERDKIIQWLFKHQRKLRQRGML